MADPLQKLQIQLTTLAAGAGRDLPRAAAPAVKAEIARRFSTREAPVRTGDLRDSIVVRAEPNKLVIRSLDYGRFYEERITGNLEPTIEAALKAHLDKVLRGGR